MRLFGVVEYADGSFNFTSEKGIKNYYVLGLHLQKSVLVNFPGNVDIW